MSIQDLFAAIEVVDLDRVRSLLQTDPTLVHQSTEDYQPDKPLHVAVGGAGELQDASAIVTELIRAGADVNAPGNNGETPLHIAVGQDMLNVTIQLVEAGARLDVRDLHLQTPFESIGGTLNYGCIGFLLSRGAGRDIREAVSFDRIDWVRWILRDDPNAAREARRSADLLCSAVLRGNPEMLRLLIASGADVNPAPGYKGPLGLAIESGTSEMVRILLEGGADPNGCPPPVPRSGSSYRGWESPLAKARARSFPEAEALLKQYGATEQP